VDIRIEQWLLPGQRPHEWVGTTPIDLLPLLRQLYPNCIDEGFLALQLVNPEWPNRTAWFFRVASIRGEGLVDITPVSQDREDGYNFGDWLPEQYPDDLIQALCQPDRVEAWQATIQLFRPEAFEMLQRVRSAAKDAAAEETMRPFAGRQAFLRDVATLLASDAAKSVDLLQPLVQALRNSQTSGPRGDECGSLWSELGTEALEPSLLHESYVDDLTRRVWSKFCELPRTTQVAVWFHVRADADFPGGPEATDWEVPVGRLESMRLSGMHDYCREIAASILGQAEEDFFQAREGD
jgi:hypothetical protein